MPGGKGTNIDQILPGNIRRALVANPSSPSAANYFVTLADLTPGLNIYTTNGTTGAGRTVSLTDTLTFNTENVAGQIIIDSGTLGTSAASGLLVRRDASGGSAIQIGFGAGVGSAGNSRLLLDKGTNSAFQGIEFRKAGTSIWGISNAAGSLDNVLVFGVDAAGNSPVLSMETTGNVLIANTVFTAQARLHLKGAGATSATNTLLCEDSIGIDHFILRDNGQLFTGSGGVVSTIATFGQWHRSYNFTTGFAFYGINNAGTAVLIQATTGTKIGLTVGHQSSPTGTTEGINSTAFSPLGSNNYGVRGLARNGTSRAIGVFGEIGGGATVVSALYVAAVVGSAHSNLNVDMFGGRFTAAQDGAGNVYTSIDMIAVLGESLGTVNVGSSGVKSIGGKFTAVNGDSNIALLVPASLNDGVVVIGADDVNAFTSIVQITGDQEIIGSSNGLILESPDASRFRAKMTDAGTFIIAAA